MSLRRAVVTTLIFCCALAGALQGCSSGSGAKKKKPSVLLTEYDDVRVGREASKSVAAEMGVIADPVRDAYVQRIGRKLTRGAPRSAFSFQFSVVDQAEPNAFALPGGFIFISRGLLVLANDEDELANVIGHEITHSARRHAAAQQALAKRQFPLQMGWMRAANMAAYGRDMEREADEGGQILAAAAGYDPMGMSTFLANLGKMERLILGAARQPTFFDTHPGAGQRAAANAARAREIRWRRDPSLGDVRAAHLRMIDGIAVNQRPEAGIFRGDDFIHPDLDFRIRFPHGWRVSNSARAVGAVAPRQDAVVYITADQPLGDPREMAESFLAKHQEEQSLTLTDSDPVKLGHIDAWRLRMRGGGRGGHMAVTSIFFPYADATWRIVGMSQSNAEKRYQGRIHATARSFRPLNAQERGSIEVLRLRIATARPGEELSALSKRTGNAWDMSRTAAQNGVFVTHRYSGGELVKVALSEKYQPGAR